MRQSCPPEKLRVSRLMPARPATGPQRDKSPSCSFTATANLGLHLYQVSTVRVDKVRLLQGGIKVAW